jgi:thioredoxin-like negative regulator of GroEL
MKRVILGLVALFFSLSTFAQQTPLQLLEAAKKATKGDVKKEKLAEVEKIVEAALNAPENKSGAEAYLYKAKLMMSMAKLDDGAKALASITGKPAKNEYTASGLKAADAIMMALKNNKDPKAAKEILKLMADVAPTLKGYTQDLIDAKDYVGAYTSFKTGLDIHKALKGAGQKSSLDKPEDYNQQLYLTGLLSGYAGKEKEAVPIYEEMMANKQDSMFVYSAMYKLKKEAGDKEGSLKVLEAGRKRYPEESSLLFAEINHYLEAGKMVELIDRLKEGIAREPKNPSLYFTLGNVYDNLSQKEPAKAEEYAKESIVWYEKTLEIDPKNADAIYSIGASYYNKAAKISQEMKKLESDFSKAGQKKYEETEKLMIAEFDKALPYFQKAESFDANNQNSLMALKEIFAKKGDLKMSKEFKDRLETIQGGGKVEKSYFKF